MSNQALLTTIIKYVGSRKLLAKELGVTSQRLNSWLNNHVSMPLEYAKIISHLTDGNVNVADLIHDRISQIPKKWQSKILEGNLLTPSRISESPISKRAEIGMTLEKSIGNRKGERNDLSHCRNFDDVKGRSDVWIAKQCGFKNKDAYRQAKKVIQKGCPELILELDNGNIAISTAALLSTLPYPQQKTLISQNKKQIISAAKHIRTQKIKRRELS